MKSIAYQKPQDEAQREAGLCCTDWLGGVGKVICVDDSNIQANCPNGPVVKGETYHVTGVRYTGGLYILGKPVFDGMDEIAWKRERFKKMGRVAS